MNIDKNKIYCVDVLEGMKLIPDNSIDVVITSPPYNISNSVSFGTTIDEMKYDSFDDDMSEEDYQKNQIEVLNELYRVLKPTGSVFYNHKLRYRGGDTIHPMQWISKSNFLVRQEIIWNRGIAANIRGWRFWQTDERIYWMTKSADISELEPSVSSLTSIWNIRPSNDQSHPCPFPEDLVKNCLLTQPKNSVVLDPYCGSGTTCIVAKKMGMNYIGFDVSKNYVDLANEKLKSTKTYKNMSKFFV